MTKVNNVIEVRKNQYVVEFLCDYCHSHTLERKSHFDKKKHHREWHKIHENPELLGGEE